MSIKLKPCPFCGSENIKESTCFDHAFECKDCLVFVDFRNVKEIVRTLGGLSKEQAWNERVNEKGGLVEELVEACDVVCHRLCNQQTVMPEEYRKFDEALARAKKGVE